ncbi:uncharacterized protein LOC143019873 [Oratosquilla oratoria]|uniref:uncharacterized protein LOC143019873 n=1 Tax=Oratosquilla oratoria TaxID=337810 RepID=UPI003F76BED2
MSRTGYAIPQKFTVFDSGERFLQYDLGENDENCMVIFMTATGIEDLKRFQNWAIDGTFKVAPKIYHQLFIIHVQKDNLSIPRALVLLPNKTKSAYRACYEEIKELLNNNQPQIIMIDFERASINALKYVYTNAILNGCFFYFSKSLYSKVVDLGYKQQYHNGNAFSLLMRDFSALVFVPPDEVIEVFEELSEDERIPSQRSPMFPIAFWNVFSRIELAFPRTYNSVEAFHNALYKSRGGSLD